MKKLVAIAMLLGATTIATGRERAVVAQLDAPLAYQSNYSPVPATPTVADDDTLHPVPAGSPIGQVVCDACDAGGLELYQNVHVKQSRKIHPCAVPKIVQVPNPCYDPCNPCCDQNPCVLVEVCVPPCGCECVSVTKNGRRTKLDYGKYAVKVTERNGRLFINYDS